jgi:predicted metal-dependent peptidase
MFTTTAELTPAQYMNRLINKIIKDPVLMGYSPLIMTGDLTSNYEHPTACTDGRNIWVNPDFLRKFPDPQAIFVMLHEAMHIGLQDLSVMEDEFKEDPQLCNAAVDYANNLPLKDLCAITANIEVPLHQDGDKKGQPFCLLDEKFRGMTAKQIYKILKQEQESNNDPQDGPEGDGQDGDDADADDGDQEGPDGNPGTSPSDDGQDGDDADGDQGEDGDEGDDADGDGEGDGQDDSGQGTPTRGNSPAAKQRIEDIENNQWDKHDAGKFEELTPQEKEELKNDIDRAIRQGADVAGAMGGNSPRVFDGALETKANWEDVFDEEVKSSTTKGCDDSTWRKFNRRMIGSDIYMPSLEDSRFGKMVIGVDTSGSINDIIIRALLTKVVAIADQVMPEEIILIYWDAEIQAVERYDENAYSQILSSTKPVGGGGTDPRCVANYIKQENIEGIDIVVMLTDGDFYTAQGEWDVPVLWCVLESWFARFTPEHGRAIAISVKD